MTPQKFTLMMFLIGTLAVLSLLEIDKIYSWSSQLTSPDILVGVEVGYDGVEDCKKMVDKVKDYTNLFVIGATEITSNVTRLDETCEYAYNAGLHFIVFMIPTEEYDQQQWIAESHQKWGYQFLGTYVFDEVGGRQIDRPIETRWVKTASNYTDAANKFVDLVDVHVSFYKHEGLKVFTSDYALYWFDYKGGYDVVLCELAWNHSRPLNIALCRGVVTVHGKEWGAMLTWTYRQPPYLESGDELYDDMVLAYQNGAKYIVVFDYPKVSQYGILTDAHFDALKRFWQYAKSNPRGASQQKQRSAYVLPKDYGWGFRNPNDKIWGIWGPDELSEKIWNDTNRLLNIYRYDMDIIHDDPEQYNSITFDYSKIHFWNGTVTQ